MTSRLMNRLDGAIARAENPMRLACLRAERAALLARMGAFDRAERDLDAVGHEVAWRPNDLVTAWHEISQGVMAHSRQLGAESAHGHFARAYQITDQPAARELRPLAAAWCASMHYRVHEDEAACQRAREALDKSEPSDHRARMRAMVVIGDSYNHCGALDVALRWHEACRRHAVSYGDDTQISGLIFNQVAFRAVFERFNQCFAHERGELSRKWALHGLDSSANYDEGIGLASHPALLPTLRAQVLVTEGRYAEALELFDRHMRAAMHQGMAMFGASYLADIAWCEFNLAHVEAARQTMRAVEGEIKRPTGDHEDRAVTHRRMATMYERLGESEGQARHAHYALKHFHAHVADEDRMRALMNRYFADLSPNEMECPALVDD